MADDAATLGEKNGAQFKIRSLDAAGTPVEIYEAGEGDAVLYAGSRDDALAQLLARDFALVAVPAGGDFATLAPAMKARRLAAIAASLGLDTFALYAEGDNASAALHLAADAPDAVQRCILVAPQVYDAKGDLVETSLAEKLDKITCHLLALFGTDEGGASNSAASFYRQHIPNCHLMYVYDAADPARDRPEATYSVIADFLRRADGFLVSEKDGRVHR